MKQKKQLKKGVTVKILTGDDKGKTGKVLSVDLVRDRVIIEGVNLQKKHRKPRKQGEKGEIIEVPRSVHVSNVQVVSK